MLLDGFGNAGNWETIGNLFAETCLINYDDNVRRELLGTSAETPPRILENCLSYDEIKLSALLSVSSYTHFINDGSRDNCGKYCTSRQMVEEFGVIIGLIGIALVSKF